MIERRAQEDRRNEPRYPLAGQLAWRRVGGEQTFTGWLSDTSRRGVSFIASAKRRISFGDELELISPDEGSQRCRVTRVEAYGGDLSLVACTTID